MPRKPTLKQKKGLSLKDMNELFDSISVANYKPTNIPIELLPLMYPNMCERDYELIKEYANNQTEKSS